MRWEKSELTHPSTGRRKYSFTNLRDFNTLTKLTKLQASEIKLLDNKSFNRWCEVSLPKVYSFFALICLRDFSANAARKIMMFLIRVTQ